MTTSSFHAKELELLAAVAQALALVTTRLPGNVAAIIPGAGDLTPADQHVFVTASGNFTVTSAENGVSTSFTAFPANTFLPLRCKKVTAATGTCIGIW